MKLLKQGLKWQVGNGEKIRFWEDNWIGDRPLASSQFSCLMVTLKDSIGSLVIKYISPSRCWLRLADSLGNTPHWIHLAEELQSLLKGIRIPYFTHTDKLVWTANPSGSFSVKSAYNLLVASFNDCYSWKEVWNSQLIPKINFFWWTTLHGKILTIDNLKRRGFTLANKCVMCNCAEESINHLFIHCPFASGVWYKVL